VRMRFPLFAKVLSLALLNLCLLALAVAFLGREQFRVDALDFLLVPARDRITALAHRIALELDEGQEGDWTPVLERYSRNYGGGFYLLDSRGDQRAGPPLRLPGAVAERLSSQEPGGAPGPPRPDGARRKGPPEGPRDRRQPPAVFFVSAGSPTHYWAGVRVPVREDPRENPRPGTLLIESSSLTGNTLFFDYKPWLTVVLAVIVISVGVWFPFIRGMTRSISQMTRAAGQIAEGRFEVHVSGGRRDEIGQLAGEINRMAARLAAFVNGQKSFLRGIAHELCTPLATIRFGLGNLERRLEEDQRPAIADIEEEVQHMSALVGELLLFSRAGVGGVEIKPAPVNVASTVARVLDREASGETAVEVSIGEKLEALADPDCLFRALSNVVRNAVRYAGHAGPIRIAARAAEDMIYITVADSGPGVPEQALEDIFAPFYRLDSSRSQQTGGLGLGLAIVRSSIEACRGAVHCRNLHPSGLEVEIRVPQAPAKL
jgi:two-component system, OmpR family, sensor histidine kinase CpxA